MNTKISPIAVGMAIFAMFFGAGNIVFPLALGQFALDKSALAVAGLVVTAVFLPIMGLFTMFLYQGQIGVFFGRLGRIPGFILSCITILLIGPLGCIPRSITVAYSTFSLSFGGTSIVLFSLIFSLMIFLFVYNKGNLLSIIGYVLSPFKIGLLVLLIIVGYYNAPAVTLLNTSQGDSQLFMHALTEGYNTMDLLGAFFFAPVIIASLPNVEKNSSYFKFVIQACLVGALLLSAIYVGFCYLGYAYSSELVGVSIDKLLGQIAFSVFGPFGGYLVSATVTIACFTTAIAIVGAFASFVQKEVFMEKIGYIPIVIGTLVISFILSTLEFQGIAAFLGPVLKICYPVLIALTAFNLFFWKKKAVEVV